MAKKEAVFILLGQSNAVGHNLPMREEDIIPFYCLRTFYNMMDIKT